MNKWIAKKKLYKTIIKKENKKTRILQGIPETTPGGTTRTSTKTSSKS
jgi:hypothetical protein